MAHRLITGADLYKGMKLKDNPFLYSNLNDMQPFNFLSQEDKTVDWIKYVADFYDMSGWNNVERKANKIQKNYDMRYGKLNASDYVVDPNFNPFHQAVNWAMPEESRSPLQQFYPLLPPLVDVLRGEFIKRDNRWSVEVIDQFSHSKMFEDKRRRFEEVLTEQAMIEKQMSLAKMGITGESNPEAYQQQLQTTMQKLQEIEFESKSFRTTGAEWAEKVLQIHDKRYNLVEIEPDAFECGLITDSEFWHLDLLDDDFRLELINPKWVDHFKGPNTKYVSQGDYFLWFDFMSAGDIVNKFGRRMKEADILRLKEIYVAARSSFMLIPDYLKSRQDAYYDYTKTWQQATDSNPVMNDVLVGQELVHNYMRTPNFDHNIPVDIFNPVTGRTITGHPQMFRVMRLYWRSWKRVGWLTKIDRDGTTHPPDWVDENYRVTIEPVYDKSVKKEETKDNLLYGEHIDWEWAPDWRHVMKISPNHKHSFWNSQTTFEAIYIDGGPVQFQFKGRNNPFDSLPPVEGCSYSYINSDPHSFIDRGKGLQIIYNIAMNKVPRQFLDDKGLKLAVDRRTFPTNNLSSATPGVDPRDEYEDRLASSSLVDYVVDRESMAGLGQPALPTVLNLSTAQIAEFWLNVADRIKWQAAENIGITRARMGGQKASETAFGVQQGINYSETQTEKYFEQHAHLMQRVRQRMIDAAQYYTTFKPSSREIYQNEMAENVWVEVEGMDNLLPHYNVNLESRANTRANLKIISDYLQTDNTLPIKPSAKIQSMIEGSVPKILTLIKEGEMEQEKMQLAQMQQEQQLQQQQLQAQQEMLARELETKTMMQDKDLANKIEVAHINNEEDTPIPVDNSNQQFANQLKQRELANKSLSEQQQRDAERQRDLEKNLTERQKAQMDFEKAKMQEENKLKIAKENKNKYDKKK